MVHQALKTFMEDEFKPVVLTHVGDFIDTTATAGPVYSFTSPAGDPASDRRLIIALASGNISDVDDVSSIDFSGNAASVIVQQSPVVSNQYSGIWWVDYPTGADVGVTINFGNPRHGCFASIFALYNAATAAFDATVKESGAVGNEISDVIDISRGGAVVGASMMLSNVAGNAVWSEMTRTVDGRANDNSSFDYHGSFGAAMFADEQAALAIGCTSPGLYSGAAQICLASFLPASLEA